MPKSQQFWKDLEKYFANAEEHGQHNYHDTWNENASHLQGGNATWYKSILMEKIYSVDTSED